MANVIKHKRGTSKPSASDLSVGEIAIDTSLGKLYTENDLGYVWEAGELTGAFSGSTITYEVKVASKTSAHRYNGSGSSSGYLINGVFSPFLSLAPGNTYKFDQSDSSNSGHPFRFYLEADKTTAYTNGVSTSGTAGSAGAYTQIVVSDSTPSVLHYQCSAHPLMGNAVVTNSNVAGSAINFTAGNASNLSSGTVPTARLGSGSASASTFLRGDGSWGVPTDTNTTYSVGDGGLTQNNFTNALKSKVDGIASGAEVNVNADWNSESGDSKILNKPTIPTNNNQLTNGSGYITATLTDEEVQDVVGAMLSSNTESGITVTYQDSDGTIDFSVDSQTDNNFTTALKNKLDGIESSATADQTASEILTLLLTVDGASSGLNADLLDGQEGSYYSDYSNLSNKPTIPTNNNQLTNGAGYTTDTKLTTEEVQDIVGAMVASNSEVNIAVTYDDTNGKLDFNSQNTTYSVGDGGLTQNNFTDALKNKLDGIESGASGDQTAGEIRTLLDAASDSNILTDALLNKLNGIAAAANNYSITNDLLDEDNMSSDSAVKVPSQQSVKAYVDANSSDTTYSAGNGLTLSGTTFSVSAVALTTVQTAGSQSAQLALTTQEGDVVVRTDENKTYVRNSGSAGSMADFTLLATPTDSVLSVNGQTGAITSSHIRTAVGDASDSNIFTDALKSKLDGIASSATNVTNTNQLTNGAGFITAVRSVESVQDIVGDMLSSNTESGITVTYQDADGTIDFSVASQTDNNFTTALKNKLDGIASGATNVTNNNQLTNGAGYVTQNTQLSTEQVQDIIGAMVSSNTETNISVTYDDTNGKLNFASTDTNTTYSVGDGGLTQKNFTTTLKSKLDGIAAGATNVTNNNQLTNGAGYVTSNTQLSDEQVQDIVGGMVSGNTVSGISVTYSDSGGKINFSVASQTDNNFTTTLKNKLDGIAASATNVTNNNQLTNGAGYITASNAAITNKAPLASPTFTGTVTAGVTNLSGELRANANVKITNAGPKISLVDSNNDDDFEIKNNNGVFTVRDATDGVDRLKIDSAGTLSIPYGVIYLGTADSSSGHLNAYENMTFNLDTDNDDTNRYFAFYKDGASGSGTELFKIEESGNATFAATVTATGLNFNDTNTVLSEGSSNALRITTDSGFVDIGPKNTSWCHFDTDRAQFYFAQQAAFNGTVYPYSDSSHNLGTSTKRWANIYGDTLYGNGANVTNVNATTLDSIDSGSFLRSDANDTASGQITFSGGISTGEDVYMSNGSLIANDSDGAFSDRSGSNIDHIWHNDSNNSWNFVSDSTYKGTGNSQIRAGSFYGDGANLTALNASNISSGTIAAARLPNHSAALLTSGTIPSARVPTLNQNTTGSAGSFTAGNASNLNSGTVNTARLPATYTKAAQVVVQSTGAGNDVKLDAADHIIFEAGEEEDGCIYFRGNSGSDSYRFSKGGQTTHEGFLSFESLGADRTYTFPNATGTIALTSDLSSYLRSDAADTASSLITFSGGINVGDLANGGIAGSNYDITGVNSLAFNDPGEGLIFKSGLSLILIDDANDNICNFAGAAELRVDNSKVWTAANDGSGSGLDADKLDNLQASQFVRSDADDNVSGHTEWQDNYQVRLGNSADMRLYHNASNSYIDNITGHIYIRNSSTNDNANIYLQARDGEHSIICEDDNKVRLYFNHVETFRTNGTTSNLSKHFYPWSNNAYDLGSTSSRWRNLYINDLNLSNEGGKNTVDGTWGDWTLQEGEDNIFMINNRSGKKFKMLLQEVS